MNPEESKFVSEAIASAIGSAFEITETKSLGGGCINRAYRIASHSDAFFLKANRAHFAQTFEVEAAALRELHAALTITVPEVITTVSDETTAYLVLTDLHLANRAGNWEAMGQQLAALHSVEKPSFGWTHDNWIGATPQPNPQTDSWSAFFVEHRLSYMLDLCRDDGFRLPDSEKLLSAAQTLLASHTPKPSLLHGDLWSGNASFTRDGTPVVFDPATYWGDRETDLAFTRFFGGFPPDFYQAYREAAPLPDGSEKRSDLYNLYHCLNHVHLFGSSYASQAREMARRIISLA